MPDILSKAFHFLQPKGIKRYEILEGIAVGGMSVVHRARDKVIGQTVALKIIKPEAMEVAERLEKAHHKSEGEIAISLRHENVIATLDCGTDHGQNYIVMEYVDGPALAHLIKVQDPFVRKHRLHILMMLGSGLAYIHDRGLLHRDFSPKNVLITSQGVAKIIDFGLCIPRKRKRQWKWDRSGTPSYMAPEQIRGKPVDARADIYGFGVMIYEVLAGHRPFRESHSRERKMQFHLNVTPPPPSYADATITPALDQICLKAMAKDADQRHQTVQEVLNDLRHAAQELKGREGWELVNHVTKVHTGAEAGPRADSAPAEELEDASTDAGS